MNTVNLPLALDFGYSIKEVKAVTVREETGAPDARLDKADQVMEYFGRFVCNAPWYDADKECVVVIALNRKNFVIGASLVSLGHLTACLIHPREVFRPLITVAANAFFLLHNHPSGDPAPSVADVRVTQTIREAARIIDIEFLDHVIVGDPKSDPLGRGLYSFREQGML